MTNDDGDSSEFREGIEAAERGDVAGFEDIMEDIDSADAALDELAEGSTASREEIEELLDLDAIRAENGEVTEAIIRRHVAAVKGLHRMFGSLRDES